MRFSNFFNNDKRCTQTNMQSGNSHINCSPLISIIQETSFTREPNLMKYFLLETPFWKMENNEEAMWNSHFACSLVLPLRSKCGGSRFFFHSLHRTLLGFGLLSILLSIGRLHHSESFVSGLILETGASCVSPGISIGRTALEGMRETT